VLIFDVDPYIAALRYSSANHSIIAGQHIDALTETHDILADELSHTSQHGVDIDGLIWYQMQTVPFISLLKQAQATFIKHHFTSSSESSSHGHKWVLKTIRDGAGFHENWATTQQKLRFCIEHLKKHKKNMN
jgi:TRAP-type mannitol/chloroaromatic compound transport system permease small subunit